MKKIIIILIALVMVLAITSCGQKEQKGFSEEDLVFVYNGEEFKLDSDVKPLIKSIGDGYEFSEAVSCAYTGMDKTYSYGDIDLYTYPLDSKDRIDEIYIMSNKYSTKKGITVGSSLDDIIVAYGENYTDLGGGMLVIAPEGMPEDTSSPCIYFIMQDGVVFEFSYYSASNRNS
jgi:hypothetical protein